MQSLIRALFLIAILTPLSIQAEESPQIKSLEERLTILERLSTQSDEFQEKLLQQKVNSAQAKVDLINEKYKIIEYGYSDISNWLDGIAIFLAVIGILAIVFPILIAKRQRSEFEKELSAIQSAKEAIEADQEEAKKLLNTTKQLKSEAEDHKDKTAQSSQEAQKILEQFQLSATDSKEKKVEQSAKLEELRRNDSPMAMLASKAFEHYFNQEWQDAIELFKALTYIDPNTANHWFHIGYSNQMLADKAKNKKTKDDYLINAVNAYEQANDIKPDEHQILNNWGITLVNHSHNKDSKERNKILEKAKTIFLKVEALKEGSCAYNLACCTALLGEIEDCKEWLQLSKAASSLPDKTHLINDIDLENVRNQAWFKEFVNSL